MSDIPYFLQSWNASVTLAALLPLCGAAAAQKQRAGSKCVFGFCATMQAVSESVERRAASRRTVKWEEEDAPCLKVGGQSSADLSLCDILQRAARYMHPDASSSFCALPLLQTRHSSTNLNKLEMFGDGLKSSNILCLQLRSSLQHFPVVKFNTTVNVSLWITRITKSNKSAEASPVRP